MKISDVNEQEYRYGLVMLMDRVYHFSDVDEKGNHYQSVLLMDRGRGYSVMKLNRPILVMSKLHKLIK
jgi:hypothetical protein